MNHPKDNLQNYKGARSNNYSKYNSYTYESPQYNYSYHNNKHYYYKPNSALREPHRNNIDPHPSSHAIYPKQIYYKERSYSKDESLSEDIHIKERKNNTDNIINKVSRDSRTCLRSEEDQRNIIKSSYGNYPNNPYNKQFKPFNYNTTYQPRHSYDQGHNYLKSNSFNNEIQTQYNYPNQTDFIGNHDQNHSANSNQNSFKNFHLNTFDPIHDADFEMKKNNFFPDKEMSNSHIPNTDMLDDNPNSSSEINLSYLKIEPSILTSLICKKSSEMMKISRKILKQNVTDFSIDQDIKAFSSYFARNKPSEELPNFTCFPNIFPSDTKIFSEEHSMKEKAKKELKQEKKFLSKKLATNRQATRNLNEKISKSSFDSRLLKIKQYTIHNKLDDIFSSN